MFRINQSILSVAVTVATSIGALLSYFYFTGKPQCKKKRRLQGMLNLGNTCFANALLQSLASCPSFVSWFQNLKSSQDLSLIKELSDVISNINSANCEEISAVGIINALEKRNWHVTYYTQQDLYELLNVFITTWDEEMTLAFAMKSKVLSLVDVHMISNEPEIESIRGSESLGYLTTLLEEQIACRSPCTGLLATQFLCTSCGHKHVRQDKICALSLSLPKNACHPSITLEHCLRKYFTVEKLFNVTCDSCKEKSTNPVVGKSNYYKRTGFSKLPNCLIIHLDRVSWLPSGAAYKQDDFVKFDEILDVGDFVFYNNSNETNNNKKWNSSVVGGKAPLTIQNPYFQQGDVLRSPLAGFCAMANNIGGLYQHPIIFGSSQPAYTLSAGDVINRISPNSAKTEAPLSPRSRDKYKYQLKAVAAHWGTHDFGHFVAYRRGSSPIDAKNWYFTSDLEVKKVRFEDEVAQCQAYMLFYERLLKC